jgi:hypothetical protein
MNIAWVCVAALVAVIEASGCEAPPPPDIDWVAQPLLPVSGVVGSNYFGRSRFTIEIPMGLPRTHAGETVSYERDAEAHPDRTDLHVSIDPALERPTTVADAVRQSAFLPERVVRSEAIGDGFIVVATVWRYGWSVWVYKRARERGASCSATITNVHQPPGDRGRALLERVCLSLTVS